MRTPAVTAVLSLCYTAAVLGQAAIVEDSAADKYQSEDAYQIYSLLVPQEESYRFAKGTLVIQMETVVQPKEAEGGFPTGPEACVVSSAASRFKEAIADYERLNRKTWLLQKKFQITKPYELVSSGEIKGVFKHGWWGGFMKRFPDSGGYLVMSAVGFNEEKTLAIVYTGSSCGSLCGRWSYHLLEKVDGEWREVPGVRCRAMS